MPGDCSCVLKTPNCLLVFKLIRSRFVRAPLAECLCLHECGEGSRILYSESFQNLLNVLDLTHLLRSRSRSLHLHFDEVVRISNGHDSKELFEGSLDLTIIITIIITEKDHMVDSCHYWFPGGLVVHSAQYVDYRF